METVKTPIEDRKVGAGEPARWARTFAAKSDKPHAIPVSTWGKKRTNFHRLSSDLHAHTHTNSVSKQVGKQRRWLVGYGGTCLESQHSAVKRITLNSRIAWAM